MRIAIQGVKAAFHDVAARKYFSGHEVTPVECASFKLLCTRLESGQADLAIMAIENSIAGSILPNYSLLESHGFKILGEVYLRIQMNIMAIPGQKIEDLKFVQSHPMALFQCEEFLSAHPHLKVIEAADTAESAKDIHEKRLLGSAAIASRLAAETYDLELLAEGIETNPQNYTRFLIICRNGEIESWRKRIPCMQKPPNKASIRFEAQDKPGSLSRVLAAFSRHSINMTKIQSVPILGRPYEYSFHVDLEWQDRPKYEQAMKELNDEVIHMIHFGEYPKSERPSA